MGSNLVADLWHRFRLYVYKKRFERLTSQYNACLLDKEEIKIKAKINRLQEHVISLDDSYQLLQKEIGQFLSEPHIKLGVVNHGADAKLRRQMIDLINERENDWNPYPSTARKNTPKDIKIIK